MDYFEKIEVKPKDDLVWNIPEQKKGIVNVVGGNNQLFKTEIKVSEFLATTYPIKDVFTVLPNVLKKTLPALPNFKFLSSIDSESFSSDEELKEIFNSADFNLILGDFSKNKITMRAVASAYQNSEKPLLITRDGVDLITGENPEKILMNEKVILLASMAQLQKLLRAIYYPKVLLLSQSLVQVAEVLHKLTLSYPISVITLHNDRILVAKNGVVKAVPLEKSGYSPIMLWQGKFAAKVAALNLYNPDNLVGAVISAIFA
ncbi:hypothetical protein IKG29_00690 [Candidatus Saccharibacteria bacterium]|nr:hypothetical protein [Candidatus Saccharibacteria bacterium]